MADELEQQLGVRPELIKGRGGVFKVRVAGAIVAEKDRMRGFPSDADCVAAVRKALS